MTEYDYQALDDDVCGPGDSVLRLLDTPRPGWLGERVACPHEQTDDDGHYCAYGSECPDGYSQDNEQHCTVPQPARPGDGGDGRPLGIEYSIACLKVNAERARAACKLSSCTGADCLEDGIRYLEAFKPPAPSQPDALAVVMKEWLERSVVVAYSSLEKAIYERCLAKLGTLTGARVVEGVFNARDGIARLYPPDAIVISSDKLTRAGVKSGTPVAVVIEEAE